MKELVRGSVVFVEMDDTMERVVRVMRDQNISSVLVCNADKEVVGIITERDIVQKFTLLPQADKMLSKAGAFMNRPVQFARLESLESDTRSMLMEHRLRHFPISIGGSRKADDVFGIITVTDMARNVFLEKEREKAGTNQREVVILCQSSHQAERYKTLFSALQFHTILGVDAALLFQYATEHGVPLICDLDGVPLPDAKKQLQMLKTFRGTFVLLSSHDKLVESLGPLFSGPMHFISRKPLNMSMLLKIMEA